MTTDVLQPGPDELRALVDLVFPWLLTLSVRSTGRVFSWQSVSALPKYQQIAWFMLDIAGFLCCGVVMVVILAQTVELSWEFRCSVLLNNVVAPFFVFEVLGNLLKFGVIPLNLWHCFLSNYGISDAPDFATVDGAGSRIATAEPLLDVEASTSDADAADSKQAAALAAAARASVNASL